MISQDDRQKADQLDRLITARQQADIFQHLPETMAADAAALVDGLLQLAASTTPAPDFVAALEQRLQAPTQQTIKHQSVWQNVWANVTLRSGQFIPRRLVFTVAILLGLLLGFFATPPAARATFWDWLYGFGLLHEEQLSNQSFALATPAATALTPHSLTLAEIQSQAPFAVLLPTRLPTRLFFTGGFLMPTATGTVVTLAYHTNAPPADGYLPEAPLLFVAISDTEIPNRPLLAAGYQRPVRVGKQAGVYTQGNWRNATMPSDDTQTGPVVWDSTIDAAWLAWQKDGLNYLLYAQGLDFTSTELRAIAVSME